MKKRVGAKRRLPYYLRGQIGAIESIATKHLDHDLRGAITLDMDPPPKDSRGLNMNVLVLPEISQQTLLYGSMILAVIFMLGTLGALVLQKLNGNGSE